MTNFFLLDVMLRFAFFSIESLSGLESPHLYIVLYFRESAGLLRDIGMFKLTLRMKIRVVTWWRGYNSKVFFNQSRDHIVCLS